MFDLDDLIDDLEGDDEFWETPVDIDTFMGRGYLEQTGITLSHYQKEMIEHMTQIFRYETLVKLYGQDTADIFWKKTVRETICMVGKGSGKDYCAEIACAYVVYKLLCMKNPALYFGKPPGDSIDIINVAINADQARNVFFSGFSRMVRNSPWFKEHGEVDPTQRAVRFKHNITVYSGHSEAEAFEGYNTLMVILDEIAGFEHMPKGDDDSGTSPAQAIYDMYNASITSRFGANGKLVLLSFPRQRGDFIHARYESVVGEVYHHPYSHTFVINPNLSPDEPGNSFDIEWTEDEIISYKKDSVWALRRPSWRVNPTKNIEEYKNDFYEEMSKALGKFAAEPQESVGGFFDQHDLIDEFSNYRNGWDSDRGIFVESFKPDDDSQYYIHVDLARKHDRCVVSMARVIGWKRAGMQGGEDEIVPRVAVELIRYWTPRGDRHVDFTEVREFIMTIIRTGFDVRKITFDQWQSEEMIKYFNRLGIESDVLSVGLAHYMDLKLMIAEKRAFAPRDEILRKEMKQLFITKNGKNVDHPRTKGGSKDLADSVCGAAFNAALLTPKATEFNFTVLNSDDFAYIDRNPTRPKSTLPVDPPRADHDIPADLARYIELL